MLEPYPEVDSVVLRELRVIWPTNETNMLINTTTTPPVLSVAEPLGSNIFRLIVYTTIFLFTVTGNVSVLAVVYKIRELHTGRLNILTVYHFWGV